MTISLYTGVVPELTQPQPEFDVNTQDFIDYISTLAQQLNDYAATLNNSSTNAKSTSSVLIGTGSKSFTIETNKGYFVGMNLKIAVTSDVTKYMLAVITSYNATTGALVVNVTSTAGTGTYNAWSLSFTSPTYGDNVTANLIGDVYASNGTSKILESGTNGTDATFTGSVNGNLVGANSVGARTVSTSAPSGGSDGDIWYQY